MKRQNSLKDLAITLGLLILCAYVFVSAGSFKGESGLFPRIIAAVTFVLCCLQLGGNVRELILLPAEPKPQTASKADSKGLLMAAGTLIGYVVLIFVTGYYSATAIYLGVTMFLFGFRKKLWIVCITAGMIAFIYLLFTVLLRVHLPSGLLI